MDHEPLVTEHIDAGLDFLRRFNEYAPVSVACWIKPTESDQWRLYVGSDDIDDGNIKAAYGEVMKRLASTASHWLHPFRVWLVNSSDPIATEAIEFRDLFPARVATRYYASSIGGLSIDEIYIYAPLPAAKTVP